MTNGVLDNSSLSKLVPSITKLNPNKSTSGHKHEGQEEVYVFYKGTGIMQIDDSKFKVKQGDVIPVPDGAFHRVFNESSEILEFAAIFNGEGILKISPISKIFLSKYILISFFLTLLLFSLHFLELSLMLLQQGIILLLILE